MRPKAWDVSDLTVMLVSQTSIISLIERFVTEDFLVSRIYYPSYHPIMLMLRHLLPVMQLDYSLILCSSNKTKTKNAAKPRGHVKISIFQRVLAVYLSFKPAQVLLSE